MDRKINIDNFEFLLREKSDEFRMYPSKRIWHSIYNNLHPGRRWPSVTMSIILIASLLLVGYLNTNNTINNNSRTALPNRATAFVSFPKNEANTMAEDITGQSSITISPDQVIEPVIEQSAGSIQVASHINPLVASVSRPSLPVADPARVKAAKNESIDPAMPALSTEIARTEGRIAENEMEETDKTTITGLQNEMETASPKVSDVATSTAANTSTAPAKNIVLSETEKAWIENFALYNSPVPKKWASKLAWQAYATPSLVYRTLSEEVGINNTSSRSSVAAISAITRDADINSSVNQHPSLGMEVGAGIQYTLLKGLNVKTGLQFNFTRYNINGFENNHPIATSLTYINPDSNIPYEVFKSTPLSNSSGLSPVKLHNETYQVSVPVGVEMQVARLNNIQWHIGATIQPTFVFGSNLYLLSSDRANYVKESSELNRWNVNAGFETFISYKINGLTWQFGPQFRSQLFSTNSKRYVVEEKLTNYGIKIGVSKLIE